MSTTPNMNLTLPDPLITPGPLYASEINTSFETIDSHNHTSGEGAPVPTAGLNINANLTFNGHGAYGVSYTTYASYTVSPTLTTSVYVINGELAYKDGNGTEVVITNNGSIAGASGTITGLVSPASASFSSITDTFVFSNNTAQGGKIAGSDYIMYKFGDTSGQSLTHKWAPASPASYTIQYPDTAPTTNDSVAKTTTAGIQTFNAYGIVPIGGIVAIASNLTGSFPIPTTGTSSRGWQLCDGVAVEAGSVLSGNVPLLNDSRFLMGSSVAGFLGGSNVASIAGSQNLTHGHNIAHTHMWSNIAGGDITSRISSDRNTTSMSGATVVYTRGSVQQGGGSFVGAAPSSWVNSDMFTTGVLDTGNGSSGGSAVSNDTVLNVNFSNASLNSGDTRPTFISTQYLIRIK